ncbi:MAG TPA: ATP-binding protein [Anaeromyxobacteraceae bacterium]|nr:ATP-binding protein [Anaeromyxobacteraceae bacterium]
MARFRNPVPEAVEALRIELAGGPRATFIPEVQLLADLLETRSERLRPKEEPERELLAAIPDAAAVVGKDARIRVANVSADAFAAAGRAAGHTVLELTRSAELAEAVQRALEGSARRLELQLPGAHRILVAHLTPLLRGEVLLLLRDVTQSREAERARRDLVANASHELRTPVTAIHGAAETLLGGALEEPAQARQFVEMIARHADRLARLTRDLLDLSRIESGQWAMNVAPLDAVPLAVNALELYAASAAERRLRLERSLPERLLVRADPRALEQVLVNLLDNAIKYTPPGGAVTLSGAAEDQTALLSVADTGPGIERHHLPRLFERFYRADAGRARDQGGTGLGLAIVKHLAQAQGGSVGVESGAGGSRFWVRLQRAG